MKNMKIIAVLALLVSALNLLPIFDGIGFSLVNTIFYAVAIIQFFIAIKIFIKPSKINYILCGITASYFIFFEVFYNIFSLSSILSILILILILGYLVKTK